MSSVTQQPPRNRALPSGWPVRRTPRWVLLVGVLLVVVAIAVALVHKPSQAERATDMRGFLQDVTTDIESCAGGVGESLAALRLVESGQASTSADVSDGISVAQQGAANCEPATNEQLDDLENYQVSQSLDGFGLTAAVTGLVTWAAPDAEAVQTDVAAVLSAPTQQTKSLAGARLSRDLGTLNAQRARLDAPITKAIKSLAMHAAPPKLPG
ncbi:MAG: hypothetical protein WBH47_20545 [Streptosporangiaceae bacterium]